MSQVTKEKFGLMVATLAELFNRELSQATLQAYWIGLSDVPVDRLEVAFAAAVKSCRFMPTPAELRSFTSDTAAPEDLAMVAFSAVANAVEAIGAYKSVQFDDPVVNATIRALGGWIAVCDKPESEFNTFFRNDFIKQYAAFRRAGVNGEITGALVGISDKENAQNGYQCGTMKLIPCGTASDSVRRIEGTPRNAKSQPRIEHSITCRNQNDSPKSLGEILAERLSDRGME